MNGEFMKNDIAKAAAQTAPPIGATGFHWWQWFTSHDLNWHLAALVSVATLFYIGLQSYYLIRNNGKKVINEP
jgi:hypothetical protein